MVARCDIDNMPRLPEFYAGRSVLITGATGFMGKVLVSRLLATCPDIKMLLLLVREKKGMTPDARLAAIKESQVFDVIRRECPSQLKKLKVVGGDVARPCLGISTSALISLDQVSVIFHGAATLKFDEELHVALDQNVLSVIHALNFADSLPNVEVFVHISTAYCMAELKEVEEKVYSMPPECEPSALLSAADALSPELLQELTHKLLGNKPNTYTFTKAVAERAVVLHEAKYPIAIFRPTIVVSSMQFPEPGWVESLNGPAGVVVGAGKGLLHVFRCSPDARADLLPVDLAIDTLIAVAYDVYTDKCVEPRVYNCSTIENPITWSRFETLMRGWAFQYPFNDVFWYPSGRSCTNKFVYKFLELAFQTLPLHVAEYAAKAVGIKPKISFIMISQRLRAMSDVLTFFSLREWDFRNDNVRRLRSRLSAADKKIFNLDPNTIVWDEHIKQFMIGTRKYLLKEKDEDIEQARKHLSRMYVIHTALKVAALVAFVQVLLKYSPGAQNLLNFLLSLLSSLYNRVFPLIKSIASKQQPPV